MLKEISLQIKTALMFFIILALLTGLIYPALITSFAQLLFPWQANGSLIEKNGEIVGSALIGQFFDAPGYFWGRPSATTPFPYNAIHSAGSNKGPSNPAFLAIVQARVNYLRQFDTNKNSLIPVDLVTASGSGLDPDISPLAAFAQAPRIAKVRHLSESDVENLINRFIKKRTFFILGEPRVNVLELNMALDSLSVLSV